MASQPHMNDLLSGSCEDPKTILAVKSLADQSRKSEEIRQSLAELPVQQKLIQIITTNLATNSEATLAALRCLGNGCIDNDTARSNLTTPSSSSAQETHSYHLHWAESSLQSPNQEIRWTAVKVLYNLCTDHEESQQQLSRTRGVWYALLHLLVSRDTFHLPNPEENGSSETEDGKKTTVTPEERTLLIDLLFWITGQKAKVDQVEQRNETPSRETSSTTTPPVAALGKVLLLPYIYNLLSTPSSSTEGEEIDLDEYATTLEITLTFLRDPSVQGEIVRRKWVEGVWRVFLDVEGKLCESERVLEGAGEGMGESSGEMVMMTTMQQQQQQQQLLRPLVSSWTWCLSDIAAQEGFGRVYDLEDPMVRELIGLVQSQGSSENAFPQRGGEVKEEKDEAMARILTEAMESTTDRDAFISSPSTLNQSRTRNSPAISSRENPQNVNPRHLSAACQILGNLLRALPAETVGAFVLQQEHQQEQQTSLHQALWHYLSHQHPSAASSTNPSHQQQAQNPQPTQQPKSPAASEQEEAQHSALSLLIQLTRPSSPQIREILGADANAEKALQLLWEGGGEGKNPGIPQGAVRLVRALGRECGVNRRRFEGLAGRMVERGLEEQQQQQQQQQRESAAGDGGSGDVGGS